MEMNRSEKRITIDDELNEEYPEEFIPSVDIKILSEIVKNRDFDLLRSSGGVTGIASSLRTDTEIGIIGGENEVHFRKNAFGSNTYVKPPTRSFFHFVWEAFEDVTVIILLIRAAISIGPAFGENGVKEGWYDAATIFVVVFSVLGVSATSGQQLSRHFDKPNCESNAIQVEAIRNKRRKTCSILDVVVGDVIVLKIGDQAPADGLFLDGHSLLLDESRMTGESDLVEIDTTRNPFLMSGTTVADGYGLMLVTSVGMNTCWGEMMSSVAADSDCNLQTPLQERLCKLRSVIRKLGVTIALLALVILLIRYFTGNTIDNKGEREFPASSTKLNDVLIAIVKMVASVMTLVVAANADRLPMAATLNLAFSVKRMMTMGNAVVRKLSACEAIGSVTTICVGKTGTLTMNHMKVHEVWVGPDVVSTDSICKNIVELLYQGVALNTTGSVYKDSAGDYEFSGSSTEKALLSWGVLDLNMDMDMVLQSCEALHVEAFNSQRRRSGVLFRDREDDTVHVQWKGEAEMVLAMCSNYYEASGEKKVMDDNARRNFERIICGIAASSLRCIAFAETQVEEGEVCDGESGKYRIKKEGLTLLGLVCLKDPCQPGAKKAVQDCKNAGINIKMITGDNVLTAKAIATECGILHPDDEDTNEAVIEGAEFRKKTEAERMDMVRDIRVMARASPSDKLLLVKSLRGAKEVVAVTGHDTYDAPALYESDIGLSMGIAGTELAKESSDIIILDDNFVSVVNVCRWGKCVYNNIQKFIQFHLTMNIAAIAINFLSVVVSGNVPLTTIELIWVNLIVDTLGALALATEKPTNESMEKPSNGRFKPLITNNMLRDVISQALYQTTFILTLHFGGQAIFKVDSKVKDTLVLNAFVICHLCNLFNARKPEKKNVFEGVYKNKLFLGIIGITIVHLCFM